MAWKYPLRNTRQNSPIDIETVNDNIHEFISEVGSLNEQNWSAENTLNNERVQIPHLVESEAALKIHSTYWHTNHSIGIEDSDGHYGILSPLDIETATPNYVPPYGPSVATRMDEARNLANRPSWQNVATLSGTAQSCAMWVMASFFHYQVDWPNQAEFTEVIDDELVDGTAQYALRYNGAIIWESATGTAEPDNDPIASRELHGPCGITLDAIIPVTDGDFKIELVGRCVDVSAFTTIRIPHGELMAFELRR